jgi:hypothetical protein
VYKIANTSIKQPTFIDKKEKKKIVNIYLKKLITKRAILHSISFWKKGNF